MKGKGKPVFAQNDHRQINKQLRFFTFLEGVGPSLPIWLSRGAIVKKLIKDFLYQLESEHDFIFVNTPILANQELYRTSGHLDHYQEYMFPPMEMNTQKFALRPMTCPHHCLVFASQNYSYQDLPVRMSENSLLFRYEKSGASHGLERVRQMELKDAHIFLVNDPLVIEKEVQNCFFMTQKALHKLGVKITKIYLSLHDQTKPEKYFNDPQLWTKTEKILETFLTKTGVTFVKKKDEAAFYGPKIDFQVTTLLEHDLTISTIQLDFLLAQKFRLKYRTAQQGQNNFATPILIHHGIIGTYERLIALLLEQNNGWLPFWLSPVQVVVFLVDNDPKVQHFWQKVVEFCQDHGLRVQGVDLKKKLSENVKKAWLMKVPVQVFIGKAETTLQKVTYLHYLQKTAKKQVTVFQLLDYCRQLSATTDA